MPSLFFKELGERIERSWRRENYNELVFSSVAEKVLSENRPSENISFWDTLRLAFLTEPLPHQVDIDAQFGQPPLTVYFQPAFRIEVLFWQVGLPGIHQHAFSGAFHVMHGSSLHSEWTFEENMRLVGRLLLGKVRIRNVELLRKGDIRPISAGPTFIHATYHLDRPSVSVVVRTNWEYDQLPQFAYLPPTLAHSDLDKGPSIQRRNQMLKMLAQCGRYDELLEIVLHFLDTADSFSAFHCILTSYLLLPNETDRNRMLFAGARRHPELIDAMRPALLLHERRHRIAVLRERVRNSDLQFFLSLLLNVPNRDWILKLIHTRYPRTDAVRRVVGWIAEMARSGITETNFKEGHLKTVRLLLAQQTEDEIAKELSIVYGSGDSAGACAKNDVLAIRNHWLFRPLFISDNRQELRAMEYRTANV